MTSLRLEKLSIMFGGLPALQDVSLTVDAGQIVGLIGPNGAGKSTLLNATCGIYKPTSGTASFGDRDLSRVAPHELPELGIARTFQNLELFGELTARENVQVGCDFRFKSSLLSDLFGVASKSPTTSDASRVVDEMLARFDLTDVASEPAATLSYGIQKRIEMARALVAQPKLILLDEPAAGANPTESKVLGEQIKRLREEMGISVLLIEHDMPLVMGVCDHVVVLDHGTKIFEGSPSEVAKAPAVVEAYLGEEPDNAGH